MSIYKFVKGSRLFMQGKRHNNDADNVADAFHPTPGTYQGGEDRSSSPYTQQQHSHSQLSNTAHPDDDIRAVHTLRSMRVDGTTEWEKSSKTVKRGGVRSRSSRTVRKITTVTRGEQSVTSESVMSYSTDNSQKYPAIASDKRSLKFRVVDEISDIVVGQEDVSAKEALLRWSQKTTQRYPGVKVSDFTQSWRDGLAFNAIIHRNRPDLVDWKKLEKRQVRERIDSAFHIMEREYGVTRLLDPEDVDTPEPDEKSIITYVSQLYDVFPEPPPGHPLFDSDGQKKLQQYKDLSSSLQIWIKEHITLMQDRNFPNTLPEMKRLAEDSHLFRVEHVPPRLHEKERIIHSFRDIERYLRDSGESVDRELHPEALERNWNHLMMLYQERDQLIHDEITRLEKLQRLADKISMEAKMTDTKLDDIESWIEDEAKRVDHLHPKDAKNNCDQIERELQRAEDVIKSMFNDVQVLRDNRYYQSNELHRRVQKVHDHWVNVRSGLGSKYMNRLIANDIPVKESTITKSTKTVIEMRYTEKTNSNSKLLEECLEWVHNHLKQVKEADYGTDLQTVKAEYERHQKEHKVIDQFQGNVEKCREAEVRFHGEELKIYGERMTVLQKSL
nr:plectin-like isoform X3 [Lepeophtheirus salmonis]